MAGSRAPRRIDPADALSADWESVPSPCVSVCRLDADTRLCTGCGRHIDEIRDWSRMTDDAKRAVWRRLQAAGW
ncbi:DUF1289 domain-containing protein [Roseospira marina]|uniref:DUF1289 domain-containing protein n=1 Tax=Roseospira marina TaxID=140057 RepID=A0A5M6IEM3_9PROT|nr:DUF1289 domain-containing protein [Roseospira marina]KAA5606723.1 DUF1289 domain-containing protein [Roseospira marina]MBB4313861.1 hypothetical protein [Roseospira marina]MBB5087023.1 hypothetical protein [Roseospira marina]